ncbi:BrnT family toxin [Treponema socranskii]|nr:BrnT family toxin [Treponema socranskii]UTD02319.1 BrnT family toxin [Treponema socranskii subsp. buccale]
MRKVLSFEWDPDKEKRNIEKHNGISFRIAVKVFSDNKRIEKYDSQHSTFDEERWDVIGMVDDILFVVYTEVDENRVRIISARLAEKEEIDEYFNNYDAR